MMAFSLASAGSLGIGFYFESPIVAVFSISVSHSFCYLLYLYFGYQMAKGKDYKS